MKKLFLLFTLLLSSFVGFSQAYYYSAKQMVVTENFIPPLDTALAPKVVGEIRRNLQGKIFVAVSLTNPLKWVELGSQAAPNLIVLSQGLSGIPIWRTQGDSALVFSQIDSTADILPRKQADSSIVFDLSNTGVSAGTYGSSTLIPVVQTDAKGRIVSISTVAAAGGGGGATAAGSTGNIQVKSAGGGLYAEAEFNYDTSANIFTSDTIRTQKLTGGNVSGQNTASAWLFYQCLSNSASFYPIWVRGNDGTSVFRLGEDGTINFGRSVQGTLNSSLLRFGATSNTIMNSANITNSNWAFTFSSNAGGQTVSGARMGLARFNLPFTPGTSSTGNFEYITIDPIIDQGTSSTGIPIGILINSRPNAATTTNWRNIVTRTTRSHFGDIRIDSDTSRTTTTDATITTISTIPLDTAGHVIEADVTIKGESTGGDIVIYRKMIRAKNVSGTVTLLGTTATIGTDFEDAGISSSDVTFDVSGTNIRIRATGVAATTINWKTVHIRRNL